MTCKSVPTIDSFFIPFLASTIQQNDLHGKSFVLSPGRKSLSMSNLVQEIDTTNCSRRTSIKSFLSSKNLDDLQVQIRRSRSSTMLSKSRESLLLVSNDKVSRLLDHHSIVVLQSGLYDCFIKCRRESLLDSKRSPTDILGSPKVILGHKWSKRVTPLKFI